MPNWPMPAGEADRALAAQMIDYWAAFAANGTPAADGAPAWPAYGDAENFMRFGARPVAERDILPGMFEFQEAIMQRRRGAGEQDRKSVVEGTSVSGRVGLGGRRIIKKKKKINNQQPHLQ